jgi:hypothetical protein
MYVICINILNSKMCAAEWFPVVTPLRVFPPSSPWEYPVSQKDPECLVAYARYVLSTRHGFSCRLGVSALGPVGQHAVP